MHEGILVELVGLGTIVPGPTLTTVGGWTTLSQYRRGGYRIIDASSNLPPINWQALDKGEEPLDPRSSDESELVQSVVFSRRYIL